MTSEQQGAILAIALHAAFADGTKNERERAEFRRIADSLASESGAVDLARLYQDVLLKRLSVETAAATLTDTGQRHFAYEMAVCVCDADGRMADSEPRFMDQLKVLVATDVAGRGIHVEGVSHVINYNLPEDPEDYVHRIGRTGRAGATGVSISFASEDDAFLLPELETLLGHKLVCEYPPAELL